MPMDNTQDPRDEREFDPHANRVEYAREREADRSVSEQLPSAHLSHVAMQPSPALLANVLARLELADTARPLQGTRAFQRSVENLRHPDWTKRAAAIRALSRSASQPPAAFFLAALHDPDETVRAAAVTALGMQGKQELLEPLLPLFDDPAWHVRETTLLVLGKQGAWIPPLHLQRALADPDPAVRSAAAWAGQRAQTLQSAQSMPPVSLNGHQARAGQTTVPMPSQSDPVATEGLLAGDAAQAYEMQAVLTRDRARARAGKARRWNPLRLALAALAGLVIISGSAFTWPYLRAHLSAALIYSTPTTAAWSGWRPPFGPNVYMYTSRFSQKSVEGIAWSPNGQRLAVAQGNVTIFDAITGAHLLTLDESSSIGDYLFTLAWSPNGKYLTGANYQQVFLWDASSGHLLMQTSPRSMASSTTASGQSLLAARVPWSGGGGIHAMPQVAWSPNGRYLASTAMIDSSSGSQVTIWNVATREVVYTQHFDPVDIYSLAWSANSQYLASTSFEHQVTLWNALTKRSVANPNFHGLFLAWSPDGRFIATVDGGLQTVSLWYTSTGKIARSYPFPLPPGGFAAINWSANSRFLVSMDQAGIAIQDAITGKLLFTHAGDYSALAPGGKYFAASYLRSTGRNAWEYVVYVARTDL